MELGLTIPLQRKLKRGAVPYGQDQGGLGCWDLHCITLRGRDSLLMVHCDSRYTVTAFDLSDLDWRELPRFAMEQLRLGLTEAGLGRERVEAYLRQAGPPVFTRTHGRREVAFLNRAWEDVLAADQAVDSERREQPLLNHVVNSRPCRCAGHDGLGTGAVFLRQSLADCGKGGEL